MHEPLHDGTRPHAGLARLGVTELEAHLDRAWPALTSFRRGPFVLRFADGYGRRSNCAVPVVDAPSDDTDALAVVEREFAARALRPTFKLVDGAVGTTALADALSRRGYSRTDTFTVLVRPSRAPSARLATPSRDRRPCVFPLDPARAAAALVSVGATDAQHRGELGAILGRMPGLACVAASKREGVVVACAVSVIEDALCSIHQLATHPAFRQQGLAHELVRILVEHAEAHHACATIAQVARTNRPAMQLFRSLEFQPSHDYAYFERTAS